MRPARPYKFALVLLCMLFTLPSCLAHHTGPMPGEPKNATFKKLLGTRVRYFDSKTSGPPVVLIHGFASSLDTWWGVIPVLSKKHRVIALDLRGFGWTDRPRGDYSPKAQAKLVFALLDTLSIPRASVVAHSWGSSVALAMALDAPKRVDKIALYDGWIYEEQLPTFFLWARASSLGEVLFWLFYKEQPDVKMANAFYDKKYVTEELVEVVEAALDRPGTSAAALAAVRGQNYAAYQEQYKTIKNKTLLLWGREDAVSPVWVGEKLVNQLPNAKLIIYPRCGHFPMIEAASASNRALADFLAPASTNAPSAPVTPKATSPADEDVDVQPAEKEASP